jgi:hypothetical protein
MLGMVNKSRQEGLLEKEADTIPKIEKTDVAILPRTTTPSVQLQVEECEPKKSKWKISECTSKITGVADPDSVIAKVRKAAEDCVSKAISILRAPSEQTSLQVDRHFHCPSVSEIVKIRKAFEQIQNHLPSVEVHCYTSPPCKKDTAGCYAYPHLGIEVCPNFFSDYDMNHRIGMFVVAAGWVPTRFATYCGGSESCYDDFTKSASEMVNNPYSYANFALEAVGLAPFSEDVHVPCRPRAIGLSVIVPPDARTNPRAIRPPSGFEPPPPQGSRLVPVWEDATGKYFIYYSGLPGGRVFMPGEGERFYLRQGLI